MADQKFDFTGLTKLAADLGKIGGHTSTNVRKAIEVTSVNIKKAWQEPLKGSAQLPLLPAAVDYEITGTAGATGSTLKSEIGFNKDKPQGPLGNISEYGTPHTTGRGFGIKALHDNEEDFIVGLTIATAVAEKEAGL